MIAKKYVIARKTGGENEVLDITAELQDAVKASGVRAGQATLMVVGSTAALSTLEYEPGLVRHDVPAALERLAPRDGSYVHEETWHDDNGHSHVRAFLLGSSLALPVVDGRVPLGTWQQVVLVELDTRARKREIVVTVVGTT